MQKNAKKTIENLKEELKKPLPGLKAQQQMVPLSRRGGLSVKPNNPKKGGVLLLLYKKNDELMVVFIQRTHDGGVHSGQISFPGGKFENADNDLVQTALRETKEEIGIDTLNVEIAGTLTELFIPVSDYMVYPAVGYYKGLPKFKNNPVEVESLIEVPLQQLLNKETIQTGTVYAKDKKFEVPVFKVGTHQIWGATAMILSEFIQVVKNSRKLEGVL